MPAVIPLAVGAIATGLGASALEAGILSLAASLLVSDNQRHTANKKATGEYNAAQVDRLANVVTTMAPRELVMGRARKGGAVYFRGSAGYYREMFLAHIALAGHEIDAVEQIYLNDQPVTLDANGYVLEEPYCQRRKESRSATIFAGGLSATLLDTPVPGSLTATFVYTSDYDGSTIENSRAVSFTLSGLTLTLDQGFTAGRVVVGYQVTILTPYARIRWDLGAPGSVADTRTKDLFPSLWGNEHLATGVAKLIAEFVYNETAFPSGIPAITARIRGAKLYDPRTGLTAFSENPVLMARHVYTHPFFGKATPSAAEEARFSTAANYCDFAQTYVRSDGSSELTNLYRASYVVPFGTPARSALDDLCQAMAGICAFAGGELYLKPGLYTAPVMTLTDDDLAVVQRDGDSESQDPISIAVHRERAEKFNVVNLRIWDTFAEYKQVALAPYKADSYIARDGQELAQEVAMPAVFYSPQAKHIAGVMLRDARDPLTFEAAFKLRAYPIELFDTVEVTLARYGWSAKTFMVMSRVWDQARGIIRLTLKETAAAIFTPDSVFEADGLAVNTALPRPFDVDPPALTPELVTSGTDDLVALPDGSYQTRVRVRWPAIADARVTTEGKIEIQWQRVGATTWTSVVIDGSETEAYLIGPVDGNAILVRARSRTSMAVSDWSLQVAHIVLGKTEPPEAPSAVALTPDYVIFTPSTAIDVKGYRILYNIGTETNRSVATVLHTGLVAGSPWPLPVRLYGVNTILVVAVDVLGNESEAAYDTQDLGLPDEANIADLVDFATLGFPLGSVTNATVVAGDLIADADPASDIYGDGSGSDIYFRDGALDVYGGSQFLALEYIAEYPCPYSGGVILLDLELAGARSTVEVRADGGVTGDVYDTARADIYANDTESIYGGVHEWRPWNGSFLPSQQNVTLQFRVSIDAGSVQGVISVMTVRTEMPSLDQMFGSVAISAAGTVISPADGIPARSYIAIEDVQITPIGTAAVAGRVKTYPIDPVAGPEVELINAAASPVSGSAFIRIRGF